MIAQDGYRINSRQVTRREYEAFASLNVPFAQTELCDTEFLHWLEPLYTSVGDEPPPLDAPIVTVSWCQASAYCGWAQQRLCGRRGGGYLTEEDVNSPSRENVDEWYASCNSADSRLEGMLGDEEWINGREREGTYENAIFTAAYAGCDDWGAVDPNGASSSNRSFRCCSD